MAQLTVTIPNAAIPRIQAALELQTAAEVEAWVKARLKDAVRDHEAMEALRAKSDAVLQESW